MYAYVIMWYEWFNFKLNVITIMSRQQRGLKHTTNTHAGKWSLSSREITQTDIHAYHCWRHVAWQHPSMLGCDKLRSEPCSAMHHGGCVSRVLHHPQYPSLIQPQMRWWEFFPFAADPRTVLHHLGLKKNVRLEPLISPPPDTTAIMSIFSENVASFDMQLIITLRLDIR